MGCQCSSKQSVQEPSKTSPKKPLVENVESPQHDGDASPQRQTADQAVKQNPELFNPTFPDKGCGEQSTLAHDSPAVFEDPARPPEEALLEESFNQWRESPEFSEDSTRDDNRVADVTPRADEVATPKGAAETNSLESTSATWGQASGEVPTIVDSNRRERSDLPVEEPVVMKMCVQGLDYQSLVSNSSLCAEFQASIKKSIASGRSEMEIDRIDVQLSAGSVIAEAKITPGLGADVGALKFNLQQSLKTISEKAIENVRGLPGIKDVSVGEIEFEVRVIEVSPARQSPRAAPPPAVVAEVSPTLAAPPPAATIEAQATSEVVQLVSQSADVAAGTSAADAEKSVDNGEHNKGIELEEGWQDALADVGDVGDHIITQGLRASTQSTVSTLSLASAVGAFFEADLTKSQPLIRTNGCEEVKTRLGSRGSMWAVAHKLNDKRISVQVDTFGHQGTFEEFDLDEQQAWQQDIDLLCPHEDLLETNAVEEASRGRRTSLWGTIHHGPRTEQEAPRVMCTIMQPEIDLSGDDPTITQRRGTVTMGPTQETQALRMSVESFADWVAEVDLTQDSAKFKKRAHGSETHRAELWSCSPERVQRASVSGKRRTLAITLEALKGEDNGEIIM